MAPDVYIVSHSINEYDTINSFVTNSWEEARAKIEHTSNWCDKPGSGTITRYNDKMQSLEIWDFHENSVKNYYDHRGMWAKRNDEE